MFRYPLRTFLTFTFFIATENRTEGLPYPTCLKLSEISFLARCLFLYFFILFLHNISSTYEFLNIHVKHICMTSPEVYNVVLLSRLGALSSPADHWLPFSFIWDFYTQNHPRCPQGFSRVTFNLLSAPAGDQHGAVARPGRVLRPAAAAGHRAAMANSGLSHISALILLVCSLLLCWCYQPATV